MTIITSEKNKNKNLTMTDQQLLGVSTSSNTLEIKNALVKKISDLDFEIDIEKIFSYIHCSQRLIQKKNTTITTDEVLIDEKDRSLINEIINKADFDSPSEFINHLSFLYHNLEIRFNTSLWKSAFESLRKFDKNELEIYVKPVVDFLKEHPFLKSEVLLLVRQHLPLQNFFNKSPYDDNKEFWQQYEFIYGLLRMGNFIFDLHAEELNTGQFSSKELDEIYDRLLMSSQYYRNNKLPQAFNVLSDLQIVDSKPLLLWHREINILFKAFVIEKNQEVESIFINTLNNALNAFPYDDYLLYVRAKYAFQIYEPKDFLVEIIATLKSNPDHQKSLFLLGQCYLQLGISRAALIVFENLKKLNPLNMQYVTAAALASRAYIDFCIKEYELGENNDQYYINTIMTLIDQEMFDEVAAFAAKASQDNLDIKALVLFSNAVATSYVSGSTDKKALSEALSCAKDKTIIQKIKEHYLKNPGTWDAIKAEKSFILDYYKEYPNDSNANYELGMLYYAQTDYEKAYDYLLKAKEIDPSNIENYYNLARVAALVELHTEAIEYISVYLNYNRYNVVANDVYCCSAYSLKNYLEAHNSAKWILSICRENEFDSKYFFYLTASLWFHIEKLEAENLNSANIINLLELYDQYPKPSNFWTNDNGSKSMYWAAKICHKIREYDKAIEYLETILQNVKEYDWGLMENCFFNLLPECLFALKEYEKLIQDVEKPTLERLEKKSFDGSLGQVSLHISYAYYELGDNETRMKWALTCARCYMNWANPPIDWVGQFLFNHFRICLELELYQHAILFGKEYFEFIKNISDNHVWLAHNLANCYTAIERQDEALKYHRYCIELGEAVFLKSPEVINSKEFVNTFN